MADEQSADSSAQELHKRPMEALISASEIEVAKDEALKRHKSVFTCSFCEFIADSSALLQEHIASHSAESIESAFKFKCDTCPARYPTISELTRHNRTHTKPFKCQFCPYSCSAKSSLVVHTRIHTGEKPFQCQYCNWAFSDKSNMVRHSQIHANVKPFKCAYCDYSCARKRDCKRHVLTHFKKAKARAGAAEVQQSATDAVVIH